MSVFQVLRDLRAAQPARLCRALCARPPALPTRPALLPRPLCRRRPAVWDRLEAENPSFFEAYNLTLSGEALELVRWAGRKGKGG